MPFKLPDEQKRFTFALSEAALPVGKVERWGNIPYLLCCPLPSQPGTVDSDAKVA